MPSTVTKEQWRKCHSLIVCFFFFVLWQCLVAIEVCGCRPHNHPLFRLLMIVDFVPLVDVEEFVLPTNILLLLLLLFLVLLSCSCYSCCSTGGCCLETFKNWWKWSRFSSPKCLTMQPRHWHGCACLACESASLSLSWRLNQKRNPYQSFPSWWGKPTNKKLGFPADATWNWDSNVAGGFKPQSPLLLALLNKGSIVDIAMSKNQHLRAYNLSQKDDPWTGSKSQHV